MSGPRCPARPEIISERRAAEPSITLRSGKFAAEEWTLIFSDKTDSDTLQSDPSVLAAASGIRRRPDAYAVQRSPKRAHSPGYRWDTAPGLR
jgi:hypothetical protein